MDRFYIYAAAVVTMTFFAANAVWTSIDGKDRPGSQFITETGIGAALMSIPNPFKADPSTYLLPDLPDADGWTYVALADPWTERPIKADGTIPTDIELDAILERKAGPYGSNMFRISMNGQVLEDRRARMNGAKRAGAHYATDTAALNVVVERLRDQPEPDRRTPLGEALHAAVDRIDERLEPLSILVPKDVYGGIAFQQASPQSRSTQTEHGGARHYIMAQMDNYTVQIWGDATHDELDALVTQIAPTLHRYTQEDH